MRHIILAVGIAVSLAAVGRACPEGDGAGQVKAQTLGPIAAASTPERERGVAELRRMGPEGLRLILAARERDPGAVRDADIDAVAGQHDAKWSRLYWYTDLDAAKAAARAERKPILYLRMLGNLTDEYSCANSRFFRTVLYANEKVSRLMREQFVLVWESERPVPVVTIDYGDGRVLKRTITGNSAHYVLDAAGNVADALPGLYDPDTFGRALAEAHEAAASGIESKRRDHLETVARRLGQAFAWEMRQVGAGAADAGGEVVIGAKMEAEAPLVRMAAPNARAGADRAMTKRRAELPIVEAIVPARLDAPGAAAAGERAVGKTLVEGPMVSKIMPPPLPPSPAAALAAPVVDERERFLEADAAMWRILASRREASVQLDANSVALIRSQNSDAYAEPGALGRVVDQFRKSIAADTVRNEFLFRRQIVRWMLESATPIALEDLNRRVYAELFLTPRSDPWLGLAPEGVYSALGNDGK